MARAAVNGDAVIATIETGATRSFLNSEVARRLQGRIKQVKLRVVMGDGPTREAVEDVEAEVKQGDEVHKNELFVLPQLVDEW